MDLIVGYGFRPTDEELIDHYLNNKILGQTWFVDNAINEVNIYNFDPWDLRFQSRIDSNDYVWYFFYRVENNKMQRRKTTSGSWKKTGPTLPIRRRRRNHDIIGEKKVLVFNNRTTPKVEWVMHEYHTSFFPPDQRTYIICKVEFKGEHLDIPSVNGTEPSHSFVSNLNNVRALSTGSEVNQPLHENSGSFSSQAGLFLQELQCPNQFSANLNTQQQALYWDEAEMDRFIDIVEEGYFDSVLDDQEIASYNVLQEKCNDYRPQESLTGLYVDDSSDSDAESTSTTSQEETLSPVDSIGTSNGDCQNHMNVILTSATKYRKERPAATTQKSRSQPKHMNNEAQGHPRRLQFQGKDQCGMPPKEKVRTVTETLRRGAEASKKEQKMEREWKMAQDRIKKTSVGWFIFEDAFNTSRKNRLINVIIGLILFVALIRAIISVH